MGKVATDAQIKICASVATLSKLQWGNSFSQFEEFIFEKYLIIS